MGYMADADKIIMKTKDVKRVQLTFGADGTRTCAFFGKDDSQKCDATDIRGSMTRAFNECIARYLLGLQVDAATAEGLEAAKLEESKPEEPRPITGWVKPPSLEPAEPLNGTGALYAEIERLLEEGEEDAV